MKALRVGSPVVAGRRLLGLLYRERAASDVRAAEARCQRVRLVAPAVEQVHASGIGGAAEHVERRRVEITIHRRGNQAERGVALTQVALDPADEVVRQRLDLVALPQGGR